MKACKQGQEGFMNMEGLLLRVPNRAQEIAKAEKRAVYGYKWWW